MGILKAKPDTGAAGTGVHPLRRAASRRKDVSIVWVTSNVSWVLDARPDSVDYIGQREDKGIAVVLGTAQTDAAGSYHHPAEGSPRLRGGSTTCTP